MNQAATLLNLRTNFENSFKKLKTIAITSGKGGVGKTNVVVNLGIALSQKKIKVAIFDGDYGLGNIDILLGLDPQYDVKDLVFEERKLEDVLIEKDGLKIIPATSGIQNLTRLTEKQEIILFRELHKLENMADLLIFDTAAGISDNVISLLLSADEIFLVVNQEPTSIVDSYAVVKVVSEIDAGKRFYLIANQVKDEKEAAEIYLKLSRACQKFLSKQILYLGYVRYDRNVPEAVRAQSPVLTLFPESKSSRDFQNLARTLMNRIFNQKEK